MLMELGVQQHKGWSPDHLTGPPDLVVVGNVCRADNPEAIAAQERGLRTVSMPQALEALFIGDRQSLVIAGISVIGTAAMTLFEIFIAFVQAYIFTILSAIFIGAGLSHEH